MKNTIRIERAKLNITQKDLAKGIGTTNQAISNIENGNYNPTLKTALKIAKFFGKNVEDIFLLE